MMRMFGSFVCISSRRGDGPGAALSVGNLFVASGSRNFAELSAALEEFGAFAATSDDRFITPWVRLRFPAAGFTWCGGLPMSVVRGVVIDSGVCSARFTVGLLPATG